MSCFAARPSAEVSKLFCYIMKLFRKLNESNDSIPKVLHHLPWMSCSDSTAHLASYIVKKRKKPFPIEISKYYRCIFFQMNVISFLVGHVFSFLNLATSVLSAFYSHRFLFIFFRTHWMNPYFILVITSYFQEVTYCCSCPHDFIELLNYGTWRGQKTKKKFDSW